MRLPTRALVAGLAAFVATPAHAVQLELTRAELCELSTTVAVVDVVDLETRWSAAPDGGIERVAFGEVARAVKGSPGRHLQVLLPGGEIDGLRHWVEDVPNLLTNARYLLFLDASGQVVGGDQGAVRIFPTPNARGESLADALRSVEGCR